MRRRAACPPCSGSCRPAAADRLRVWMLPTLAIIKQEKTTDYIVGLDELGGEDFAPGGGC